MKSIKILANVLNKINPFFSNCAVNGKLYEGGLLLCVICIFFSFNDLITRFHESPFDGVFQTLFALRRMDAGEFPGRDFFYFHGNGIPYLLYPIYWILHILTGRELSASLWSTFIINLIFLYIPIYVFFLKRYGRKFAAAALLIISLGNEFFFTFGFYNSPLFVGAPMGVRLSPHMLMLATFSFYNTNNNVGIPRKGLVLLGLFLGISPLLGAEQGVFAIGGASVALLLIGKDWRERFANFLILPLISVSTFLTMQLILFGGFDTIRAMKTISDNQVWVYGVFPNAFFSSIHDVFSFSKVLAIPSQVTTIVATCAVVFLVMTKRRDRVYLVSILAIYFGGLISWVSNIGYVGQHQSAIFMRLLLIVTVVFILERCSKERSQS